MLFRALACLTLFVATTSAQPPSTARAPRVSSPEMDRLVRLYFESSPYWHGLDDRVDVLRHRSDRALALPDPSLTYRWLAAPVETRVGPQRHGIRWQQMLPPPGVRSRDARRLDLLATAEDWGGRARAVDEVSLLRTLYLRAAERHATAALLTEEREMLRRFEQMSRTRYSTGVGNQVDVLKLQADVNRLEDALAEYRQSVRGLEARAAGVLGLAPVSLAGAELPAHTPSRPPPAVDLAERAAAAHPAVRALELERRAGVEALERDRRAARPDVTLGVEWVGVDERRDVAGRTNPPEGNGDDSVALSVGLRLPLDRRANRSLQAETRSRNAVIDHRLAEVRATLRAAALEAAAEMDALVERLAFHDEVLLPQAREALSASEAAYRTGRLGAIDLLDARRVYFETRRRAVRLRADYWLAAVALQRATGDLPELARAVTARRTEDADE